jgi:hypothetical protein
VLCTVSVAIYAVLEGNNRRALLAVALVLVASACIVLVIWPHCKVCCAPYSPRAPVRVLSPPLPKLLLQAPAHIAPHFGGCFGVVLQGVQLYQVHSCPCVVA